MGVAMSGDQQQDKNVSIELDKTTHLYVPGETVSGTVFFNQLHHHNGVISIDLIGEVGCTMANSIGNDAASTIHYRFSFFTVSKASITDGEKFDLCLDENLPPSVNLRKGVYPYIRYLLQVNLSKTNKHRHWIIVCPRFVIPQSTIHPIYFDVFNHREVRLVGSIDLEWLLPGDKFQVEYQISNPNHVPIKYMDGSIIMQAKFKGGEYSEKVMDIIINNVYHTTEDEVTGIVPLVLPLNYFPPTCNYTNDTDPFHVIIEYWLVLEIHIKAALHNLKTRVPLIIGFEPDKIASNGAAIADQQRHFTSHLHFPRIFRRHHSQSHD
jgi:hypothetical protein